MPPPSRRTRRRSGSARASPSSSAPSRPPTATRPGSPESREEALLKFAALVLLLIPAPDDAAELQTIVQTFFAAAAKKDAAAARAVWSPTAPGLESILDCVSGTTTPVTDLRVSPFSVVDDDAAATIRFSGRITSEDGKFPDEVPTRWRAAFRRENGAWKWVSFETLALTLARELSFLTTPEQRRPFLEAQKADVTYRVVTLLTDAAARNFVEGKPELARRQIDAAMEAAEVSGRDELRAKAVLELGEALMLLGRSGEAVAPLRWATAFYERVQAFDAASNAGSSLGYALVDSGRPEEALVVLAIALKAAEKNDFRYARFHAENYTGMAHARSGATETALLWHEKAAATAEGLKRPDLLAAARHEIGRIRWEIGDFGGALEATLSGLALCRTPEDRILRVKLLNSMGLIYISTAEYPKAQERLEAALAEWRTLKVDRGTPGLLTNLAEAHRNREHYPEAVACLKEAIEILERIKDLPTAIAATNNLGLVYRFQGLNQAAVAHFQAAADVARKSGNAPLLATALVNLSEFRARDGRFEEALKMLAEAVELAEKSCGAPQRFLAYQCNATACLSRNGPGDLERAVGHLRKAAATLEGSRAGLRDPALKQSFLSQHAQIYSQLAGALHQLGRDPEAFAASEEGKARTLVDLLEAGSVRIVKSMTEEERREEAQRDAELRALLAKMDLPLLTDARIELETAIARKRDALEEVRRGIYARHPELQGLRGRFTPAPLEELNRRLSGSPRTAILSYLTGPTETLLFVLTSGETTPTLQIHPIAVPIETLKKEVDALWSSCSVADARYRESAQALYERLILPAGALKGVEHIVLSPDGVLQLLPFQALQDKSGKHLIEHWSVSFAPSVTALLKMEDLAAQRRTDPAKDLVPLLAVGAPTMPPGYSDLPHAKAELEAIAKRFKVAPLTGADATETAVKSALEKARRILIATHGKVDEASPLYSFVVLGKDEKNDGFLHAKEIVDLNLRAELVVLSACETALGKQVRGEGVVGLTWALFAAGTPATLLSQWQVSDESTGRLMESFMSGLATGTGFAAALKQAQLDLMKDPKRSHPYYWAPFILIGAGRN